MSEILAIELVVIGDRVRKEFGDIDELCNSIKSVGLIQPIVITRDFRLIAGERRLRALKRVGVKDLVHSSHFVFNDELDDLKLKAMEIEENVKRKELSWQETIIAKKRLLEIMQQIHGVARPGYPSRTDSLGITSPGFGINKLAALLGESNAQTSKDIELAELIAAVPQLAKAETKEAARRQASLAIAVAGAIQQQAKNPPKSEAKWTLYEGDFLDTAKLVGDSSVDLVLVDPPYGEETSGMGPNSKQLIASGFADSEGTWNKILGPLIAHSIRVLRQDRFAAFFFGFTFYQTLLDSARLAGFSVDVTPLVWVKNTVINTSPYTRYGRSYEPILLCRKGEPKLMRPAQRDVIEIQNVITRGTNEQKYYHAQKPVELMEKLIGDMCVPEGTVVDFCAGSGSTGVAAVKTKRKVILFEKDVAACNIIRARLGAL